MFERFTRPARTAVVNAQDVAARLGSARVDTRHLLLALLETSHELDDAVRTTGGDPERLGRALREAIQASGLDREALASLGIDLDAVTERADRVFGPGSLSRAGRKHGHIGFARDARKALELALRETIRLEDRTIGPRHLLLGVLRADCPGRAVLVEQRVDLGALRRVLEGPAAESA